jgi:hypothetical protein
LAKVFSHDVSRDSGATVTHPIDTTANAYMTVMELFTIYTRLVFGATMILAVLCVLLELIGGAL